MSKDNIYADDGRPVDAFRFNQEVVDVFEDMISRSVPHYIDNLEELVALSLDAYQAGTRIYDLGCSKGALALPLALAIRQLNGEVIAVDNAPAMIAALKAKTGTLPIRGQCQPYRKLDRKCLCSDSNYVLQFIPREERINVLERVHNGLTSGGILLLSEKICHPDPTLNQVYIDRHHAFKKANGYSLLEISRKRQALEDVLVPETLNAHLKRLRAVGFTVADVWDQHYNWVSIYCRK